MRVASIHDVAPYNPDKFVAQTLIEGDKSNVRIIRLSAGQTLPPHTHAGSDLFLFAAEGQGEIVTDSGPQAVPQGSMIAMTGTQEPQPA